MDISRLHNDRERLFYVKNSVTDPATYLFFAFLLSLIWTTSQAHNGALAYAYPISGISIDGDLREWPDHLHPYKICKVLTGVKPKEAQDLDAHFKVGYDMEHNVLYFAVEVIDESILQDTSGLYKLEHT